MSERVQVPPRARVKRRAPMRRRSGPPSRHSLDALLGEEEELGRVLDRALLARLWRWVRPFRAQLVLTLLLAAPIWVMQVAPSWLVMTGLDREIIPGLRARGVVSDVALGRAAAADTAADAPSVMHFDFAWLEALLTPPVGVPLLWWFGLLMVFGYVLAAGLEYLQTLVMVSTGQAAMRNLRREVFAHIQKLHIGFFANYPVGRLVTRATSDVEHLSEMFSAGLVLLVTDLLRMVGFAALLFWVDARLALWAFVVVPPLSLAMVIFRFKVREAFRASRVLLARINASIQENLSGMKVVQLFAREARNQREFSRLNGAHRDAWLRSIWYDSALFSVVDVATGLITAVVIAQALETTSVGVIFFFLRVMTLFFMPLRDLSQKYSVMQSAMASFERVVQLLDTEPEIHDAPTAKAARARAVTTAATDGKTRTGAVTFENVWFAYPGGDWVLRDVSFRVAPGEKVAVIGATGAGKSTLINLLVRFHDVTRGRILLDGADIRTLPQEHLHRRVGLVLQDVFLWSGSIEENLTLGREDISPERMRFAARAVHAAQFIEKLPRAYQTEIHERGANFSAGQQQLLSFARALVHGADVLVLDEATSAIDPETEALVQHGIHVLMAERTSLVIAHRLSTIEDADRIHVLDHGQLVETGSHEELLAHEGLYARLHRLQQVGVVRAAV